MTDDRSNRPEEPVGLALDAQGPAVDVRVVLFTVASGTLLVTLQRDAERWRLPRGFPFPGIPLDAAARTIVYAATSLHEHYLEQLYTLSVREEPAWSVIVCYMALIPSCTGVPPATEATWRPAAEMLAADALVTEADRMVIDYALVRLRAKLGYTTIAFHLMPESFTLSELQGTYEAILGQRLDKRNFRRRMIASGILEPLGEKRRDGSHRPAQLYRFRAGHDPARFLTPPWAGDA